MGKKLLGFTILFLIFTINSFANESDDNSIIINSDNKKIYVSKSNTCFISNSNKFLCAKNIKDENATNDEGFVDTNLGNVISVTKGRGFYCALVKEGTVFCLGENSRGQIGNGTNAY